MMTRRFLLAGTALAISTALVVRPRLSSAEGLLATGAFPVTHTDAEWKQRLSADQYAVLRTAATERPFTSDLLHEKRRGDFACAGCGRHLYSSTTKYDSGTGWPSFWAPLDKAVGTTTDRSLGMERTEVHCGGCGSHLGHVFDDGPKPTGLRYCMNGVAMTFVPAA